MNTEFTKYGKNIDVFDVDTGKSYTIIEHLDLQITKGVSIRVCLLKEYETGELKLQTDRQLLLAYDKHVSEQVGTFDVHAFRAFSKEEDATKIIGEGNLIKYLWGEINRLTNLSEKDSNVVLHIRKTMEIEI